MRVRSAIAAFAVLAIGGSAFAEPDVFTVNSFTSSTDGVLQEDFTIAAYTFGTTDFIDAVDNGLPDGFFIEVNSGLSDRPDWTYELSLHYAAYDLAFFLNGSGPGIIEISLLDIKDGGFPIDSVFAKDSTGAPIGTINTDGSSIFWDATVQEVFDVIGPNRDLPITIQWNQVPTPGVLALFGLAGFMARRRGRG
jgi:hypothetical protein